MDLNKCEMMARNLMDYHGLNDWTFAYDRAKFRRGLCTYSTKTISLSGPLTVLIPEDDVLDTILHEIAHAIAPPNSHHNYAWRAIARSIGCSGEIHADDEAEVKPLYVGFCSAGNHTDGGFHRMPKRQYSCTKCSPKFDRRFILTIMPYALATNMVKVAV